MCNIIRHCFPPPLVIDKIECSVYPILAESLNSGRSYLMTTVCPILMCDLRPLWRGQFFVSFSPVHIKTQKCCCYRSVNFKRTFWCHLKSTDLKHSELPSCRLGFKSLNLHFILYLSLIILLTDQFEIFPILPINCVQF
mgnify:CR=1 FL=1